MKKITNITIGGVVFACEEDAYVQLSTYLQSIETTFRSSDDYKEIANDIESAVAEKFVLRKKDQAHAITCTDVSAVIAELGNAEDLAEESSTSESSSRAKDTKENTSQRRLYRNTEDAVIGGVSSGLAQYFSIDPVIVRVLFVILFFFDGLGVILYLILWFIVPAAKTTEQKFAMRGEAVTLSRISERVKERFDEFDASTAKEEMFGVWLPVRSFLMRVFAIVGTVVQAILKVLWYVVGVGFVAFGALGFAGVISLYCAVLLTEFNWADAHTAYIISILRGDTSGILFVTSGAMLVLIPLIVVALIGASLLMRRNVFTFAKTISLSAIWIIALSVAGTTALIELPKLTEQAAQVRVIRVSNDTRVVPAEEEQTSPIESLYSE